MKKVLLDLADKILAGVAIGVQMPDGAWWTHKLSVDDRNAVASSIRGSRIMAFNKPSHLVIRNMFCRHCGALVAQVPSRYFCDDRCARAAGIDAAQHGFATPDYQRAMEHYRRAREHQGKPEEILDPAELENPSR